MSLEAAIANHIIPVVAIVFGVSFLIIATLTDKYCAMRKAEHNAVLKRMMIEKGFTSDEIIAVVRAAPGNNKCQKHSKVEPAAVT